MFIYYICLFQAKNPAFSFDAFVVVLDLVLVERPGELVDAHALNAVLAE